MKTILWNVAAVLIGFVLGSIVNMVLIAVSPLVIPPPVGVDLSKAENLKASVHLFEAKHFLFPFLAHAVGTFVGSLVAYGVARSYRSAFAYTIGGLFLAGGIAASFMIPSPAWFIAVDLMLAYLPMAWLAIRLGVRFVGNTSVPAQS